METGVENEIKIDAEFKALIPLLRPDEYKELETSILSEGCRDALVVWNGLLVDGHNRLEICNKYGIEFSVYNLKLADRLDVKIWICRNQSARRNLTDDQRAMVGTRLQDLLSEQAKKERAVKARSAVTARNPVQNPDLSDTPSDKSEIDVPKPKTDTRAVAAKSANVSERKMKQAQTVRRADPELATQVENGTLPLAAAVREIKRKETIKNLESVESKRAKEIEGVYDVIVIDPPWPMKKIERDLRPNQSEFDYPTMPEEELEKLEIPCAEDAHVFVWTTQRFLPTAFRLLECWNLKYVCSFVWHKPGGFQPIGLPQYNCEFALYARRGTPKFIDTKNLPTCFQAKRHKHSEKPDLFYETLCRVTAGRRLDMFNRRNIEGFDGWGKESEK